MPGMALRCPAIRRMEPANDNTRDWLANHKSRLHGRPLLGGGIGSPPRKSHQKILSPGQIYLYRSSRPADFSTKLVRSAAHSVPVGCALDAYRSLHFTPTAGCQQSAARMRAGPQRKLDGTALFRHRPSRRANQPMQKRQYALGGRRPGVVAPITIRKPQQFHEACLQKRTDAPGRGHTNTPTRQAPRDQRSPSA